MLIRFERRGAGEYLVLNHTTGERLGRLLKRHAHRWDIYEGRDTADERLVGCERSLISAQVTARFRFNRLTITGEGVTHDG